MTSGHEHPQGLPGGLLPSASWTPTAGPVTSRALRDAVSQAFPGMTITFADPSRAASETAV